MEKEVPCALTVIGRNRELTEEDLCQNLGFLRYKQHVTCKVCGKPGKTMMLIRKGYIFRSCMEHSQESAMLTIKELEGRLSCPVCGEDAEILHTSKGTAFASCPRHVRKCRRWMLEEKDVKNMRPWWKRFLNLE